MFTNQIKFSSICPYTGDFIVSSSKNVVLMNINGLFLSQMSNVHSKINSCCISVIPMTESDLFLFTGHKDGSLIVSKLLNNFGNMETNNNKNNEKIIDELYHEAYNNLSTDFKKYLDKNNLSFNFDIVIKIKCSEHPIRFIKLTEDLTEIICIDNTPQWQIDSFNFIQAHFAKKYIISATNSFSTIEDKMNNNSFSWDTDKMNLY